MDVTERTSGRLSLHDLKVFLAVVAEGSMGKAASRLHTSQPAVSRTISELEGTLSVPLLERRRDGVVPTPYGKTLAACGTEVFDSLQRGIQSIESLRHPGHGEVVIGSNPVLAASVVPAAIEKVRRRHPGITFEIMVGPTQMLRQELLNRSVDLLVTRADAQAYSDGALTIEPLFEDGFVLAAGAGNPLVRRRHLDWHEMARQPWVLPPPESRVATLMRQSFIVRGMEPPVPAVVAVPLDVRLSLLTHGRYVTVLPACALRLPRPQEDIRTLMRLDASVSNVLVSIKDRELAPAAHSFIQAARTLSRAPERLSR